MPSRSARAGYFLQYCDCQVARCREVERDEGMVKLVKDIQGSDPMASALLVECRGRTPEALEVRHAAKARKYCMCLTSVAFLLMCL